jgi:hypothetical protein
VAVGCAAMPAASRAASAKAWYTSAGLNSSTSPAAVSMISVSEIHSPVSGSSYRERTRNEQSGAIER